MNRRDGELVSIIIPTYNCEKSIRRTIESVKKQTYTDWEIIIVDDCSSDQTIEVIESFSNAKIKIIKLDRNEGPAYARQVGIEKALGMYIIFMDSDDWYNTSTILEHMVNTFVENKGKIDCVMMRYITIHKYYSLNKGKEIHVGFYDNVEARENKIITDSPMWHYLWNKMYLAKAIKNKVSFERKWQGRAEDVKFNREYLKNSIGTYVINEYGYCYNCQGESLTRSKIKKKDNSDDIKNTFNAYENEFIYYKDEISQLKNRKKLKKIIMEKMFIKYLNILDLIKRNDINDVWLNGGYYTNSYKECVSELRWKQYFLKMKYCFMKHEKKMKKNIKNIL